LERRYEANTPFAPDGRNSVVPDHGWFVVSSDNSNYYPEPRYYGFLIAAWGLLLGLLLLFVWVRPTLRLLRAVACAAFVPLGVLLLALIWSGFRYGWDLIAAGVQALDLAFPGALALAYFCVAHLVSNAAQANYSLKRTAADGLR